MTDYDIKVPITNTSLSLEEMKVIYCDCEEIHLEKGDALFMQGEKIRYIYWLKQGRLESYYLNVDGKKKLINILMPNSLISSIQVFSPLPSLATAVAMEDSILYRCSPDQFIKKIVENDLMHHFMTFLAEKFCVQGMTDNILHVTEKEDILLHLYKCNLTHQQIADFLGCSREYVTRCIKKCNQHNS